MARLIYSAIASIDGYIEDEGGRFDWAVPDDEVHAFINDRERSVGTHLYGRRMYETMSGWETDPSLAEESPLMRDYAEIWRSADKVVFSRTLDAARTARTRIVREFDPDAVRQMMVSAEHDVSVSGPDLARHAFMAGLVDECHLYLVPVVVGGGKPALPRGLRIHLDLRAIRRFAGGTVHLRYQVDRRR